MTAPDSDGVSHPPGLDRTLVNEKNNRNREDWYSQHLYTVGHVLEAMRCCRSSRK